MNYLALLRGINVGGNHTVSMESLRALCTELGFTQVRTYINSGNVLFSASGNDTIDLAARIEAALKSTFGFEVPTLVITEENLRAIAAALPTAWKNDTEYKCDVFFLWPSVDNVKILKQLPTQNDTEVVKYVSGAVFWYVARSAVTRSQILKLVGTPLYKQMTVRNCNTVRKLTALMEELP